MSFSLGALAAVNVQALFLKMCCVRLPGSSGSKCRSPNTAQRLRRRRHSFRGVRQQEGPSKPPCDSGRGGEREEEEEEEEEALVIAKPQSLGAARGRGAGTPRQSAAAPPRGAAREALAMPWRVNPRATCPELKRPQRLAHSAREACQTA